ncbi:uncharacterized protein LOC100201986 isoform X1 [Hydra vulgaris]|uniref:uncharacterized protein LOC100201986 isoform X1 n=1 Tax=Hydra vulgaris TaxID=6087 RepID=UPI001F5E4830|nr:uncharacterized protein LOC100201986 [Hydra vulgaris]XP_047125733.1 uncharacterized protein LOC100201986 [Hydra vulgaris]
MNLIELTLLFLITSLVCSKDHGHKQNTKLHKKRVAQSLNEPELRRTKRLLYQSLLNIKSKREVGIDIDERTTVSTSPNGNRPYVKKQVQEVRAEIKLIHPWRVELSNKTSPEYMLIVGNLIDAINNEFVANYHFLSSAVSNLRPTAVSNEILAVIAIRFFKTEIDPIFHLHGIISRGWISNQQVDPKYFKVLEWINGNNANKTPHTSTALKLRLLPALIIPENKSVVHQRFPKKINVTSYIEVHISIKLKQHFVMFLEQNNSPEFVELSGNIEYAISKIFTYDSFYIDAHVIEFRESEEGLVIVECIIQFKLEERHAIEKCEAMIAGGDLDGMPVDNRYFKIIGISEKGIKIKANHTFDIMQSSPTKSPKNVQNNTLLLPLVNLYKDFEASILSSIGSSNDNVSSPSIQVVTPPSISLKESSKPPLLFSQKIASPPLTASKSVNQPNAILPLSQSSINSTSMPSYTNYTDIPFSTSNNLLSLKHSKKLKPLRYKEVRLSIKMEQPWNKSFSFNNTKEYIVYSATIEEAVDRALMEDDTYIDATVLDFLKGDDDKTIVNLAVRFHLQEPYPQQKLKNIIGQGTLSGFPVDKNFFYVFSLSETVQPPPGPKPSGVSGVSNEQYGQKQQAHSQDIYLQDVKPLFLSTTSSPPSNFVVTSKHYFTEASTFNPYLPKTNENKVTYNPFLPLQTNASSLQPGQQTNTSPSETELYKLNGNPTQPSVYLSNGSQSVLYKYLSTESNSYLLPTEVPQEANEIEGFMTLQQSWQPSLGDKNSQLYRYLESSIVSSVKEIYSKSSEFVSPNVIGFSEADIPSSYDLALTEKKVGVRFKIKFMAGHKALSEPLEHAVLANNLTGILVQENSLVLVASSSSTQNINGTLSGGTHLTICQQQQLIAESSSGVTVGGFIPQCLSDGNYKTVQCHALTGFCWCVNNDGVRIQGTEERYKEPNCSGLRISGNLILPEDAPTTLPSGSCITLFIQELVFCGKDITCNIPVAANQTIYNFVVRNQTVSYQLDLAKLKYGKYSANAVINVGWCRSNAQDLIHRGDYHSTTIHDFEIDQSTTKVLLDINLEKLLPEETGIKLEGSIILPEDSDTKEITAESCLSLGTKQLHLCKSSNCLETLHSINTTIRNLTVINNTIPYSMDLPNLDPGTYIISAVLHVSKCPESSQIMVSGDYYNDVIEDYEVTSTTSEIVKDFKVIKLNDVKGVFVTGRVILSNENQVLPPETCLTVSSRKLIQCKNAACQVSPVATKTFVNVINNNGIPYSLQLMSHTPGKYIISAVVNLGWCRIENGTDWIKEGDLYNDKIHDYEIDNKTTVVGKNIYVVPLASELNPSGPILHGDIILPQNVQIKSQSCLTVKAQEMKLCSGVIDCVQPITAKETFYNVKASSNRISYSLALQQNMSGNVIISAVLHNGWCRDDTVTQKEWIRSGDYHSEDLQDFILQENQTEIHKDIEVYQYSETMTGPPPNTNQPTYYVTSGVYGSKVSTPFVLNDTTVADDAVSSIDELNEAPNQMITEIPITQPASPASNSTQFGVTSEEDLIDLPEGLPKSCKDIRSNGIGHMDGQYVIELRKHCHLSIICQDMNEPIPREFLGGASEEEWKYWHYAILIRINENDKRNMPSGACLENSENGKDLLRRIKTASASQTNPIEKWRSSISNILRNRSRRNVRHSGSSVITKAKMLYKIEENPKMRSSWGVL